MGLYRCLPAAAILGLLAPASVAAQSVTYTTLVRSNTGVADGVGPAARFNSPRGITIDGAGTLYVLDRFGFSLRKITPGAVVSTLIPADNSIFGVTLAATPSGEVLFVNMTSSVVRKRAIDGTLSVVYAGSNPGPFLIQQNGLALDSGGVMYANDALGVWRLGTDNSAVRIAGGGFGFADGPVGTALYDNALGMTIDSSGIMYVSDQHGTVIRRVTPDGVTTTIAGLAGSTGTADGTGTAARFSFAGGLVCDVAGNVYVADGSRIRRVTPQGVVTTFVDSSAGIASVSSLTIDSSGNLFVADGSQSVIWKVAPDGSAVVFAGLLSGTSAGIAGNLQQPSGVAIDADGAVLISDTAGHTINRLAGGALRTIAGVAGTPGGADGAGAIVARLGVPNGIAIDGSGTLFFADAEGHAIRRVTPDGLVTTIAGRLGSPDAADGTGGNARFNAPVGMVLDSSGNLIVGDSRNCAIRRVTPSGSVTTIAGRLGACGNIDGAAATARLGHASHVAIDAAGNLYIADRDNQSIRRAAPDGTVSTLATGFRDLQSIAVDAGGNVYANNHWALKKISPAGVVTTVAGAEDEFGTADGSAGVARFRWIFSMLFAPDGTLYIGDSGRLRTVSPDGTVTTLASLSGDAIYGIARNATGTLFVVTFRAILRVTPSGAVDPWIGTQFDSGSIDGAALASARLNAPRGLVAAGEGAVYVADSGNHAIRRLAANQLTTIAGSLGTAGAADGPGASARFNGPSGVASDAAGNLYIADSGNHAIRRLSTAGVVTTIAGQAGSPGSADGAGTSALFNNPRGVAVDSDGTIYVADTGNHAIRAIGASGLVTTLAGIAGSSGSADGTGAAARFASPEGLTLAGGILYVGDTANHTIRAVTREGAVTTVGGSVGTPGVVDGAGSTARFAAPAGLSTDPAGAIYIADALSGAVRAGVIGTATAPLITTQPVSRSAALHETVQLICGATGNPSPSFSWERAGVTSFFALSDSAFISGVNTRTLTITDVGRAFDATQYRCVARNLAGSATSSVATLSVPILTVTPSQLAFGAIAASGGGYSTTTSPRSVAVGWQGSGAPSWSVAADKSWVQLTNATGAGPGQFTVAAGDPGIDLIGNLATANLTFTAADPENNATITVRFFRYISNAAPVGVIDTPASNATGLQGSLPVTGWALDDVEIDHVEIWRDAAAGETTPVFSGAGPGNGKIFIANATFVPGARPDVQGLYEYSRPDARNAGWGYMLLTQGLWNQGNGAYTLYAFAFDKAGASSTIGTKTITVDNANATKPFGTIDTPSYGGTVSGTIQNFGWALTPGATCTIANPNVQMSIDSGALTPVVYGDVRTDVAGAFPAYTNAAAAGGHYTLDTTTLTNGMHTIGWFVTDSCARADGMGSRFFTVANSSSTAAAAPAAVVARAPREWTLVRGTKESDAPPALADGTRVVRADQGERIELQLPGDAPYTVAQLTLPIGSSFDASEGKFYWQPAAGFLGAYDLVFNAGPRTERVRVVVGPPIRMVIDTPRAGNVLAASGFTLAGWAVDLASLDGAGIDTLHVWAYPVGGGAPVFVGVARGGGQRPDVERLYGPAFGRAGFTLSGGLPPGTYDFVVYAHSAEENSFAGAETVRVIVR